SILLIFFSYVTGYSAHLVVEKLLFYFYPEWKETVKNVFEMKAKIPNDSYKSYNDSYSNFIMFRHLFIATILLGFSLYNWFRKSKMPKFKYYSLITCLLFAMIFFVAYLMKRDDLIQFKNAIMP
ncbi:MAG: hypothetical protein WAM24_20480, partial [Ignavibacteriaceae bacterium]